MVPTLVRRSVHTDSNHLRQTGMGRNIEMFHRTYKFDAILGGAEEILGDLGVRQAMKGMPKAML